jgi:hypothetical protein
MRYLVFTALALVLLVGAASALPSEVSQTIVTTASGGDIYQEAYNSGDVEGEGALLTQSTTMTADGTGIVEQEADNYGYADGAAAVVTQSISQDATGETVLQNYWEYGNYAYVFGIGTTTTQTMTQVGVADDYLYQYALNYADPDGGSLATQSISQMATAGGDVDQYGFNEAWFYGDGAVAIQSVSMDANAGGYAYQLGYNDADMGDYDTIMVDQSATLNAVAGDYVYQYFYNDNSEAGSNTVSDQAITMSGTAGTWTEQILYNGFETWDPVSEATQVLTAGATAADGSAYQDAYNWMYTFGDDNLGQSIFLNAVATEDVTQLGYNDANTYGNLNLGQEVWLGGDGAYVYQEADNWADLAYANTVAQYIALSAVSDDAGVDQIADNFVWNVYWNGDPAVPSSIAQGITGAATGGVFSQQYFYNYADLSWDGEPSSYTVTQDNVANIVADDLVNQGLYNWIDWWAPNTGAVAQNINGDASATSVWQYHENWMNVF